MLKINNFEISKTQIFTGPLKSPNTSKNAQNDCPDVFFKLGESIRNIERKKKKKIQLDFWEYGWILN